METDTSEKGIETLIVRSLIDAAGNAAGNPEDCDREYTVGLAQFPAFMVETQPERSTCAWRRRDSPKSIPSRTNSMCRSQATETGVMGREDAGEMPEELAMKNEATV